MPGMVLGTVGYMAPEQVRGEVADARTDVFALGAVFYEMLAGRRAFTGDSVVDMSAILRTDPPEFAAGAVPAALDRIIRRCLEKHPAQRFQSAGDVAFALEAVVGPSHLAGQSGRAGDGLAAARRARRWPWRPVAARGRSGRGGAVLGALRLLADAGVRRSSEPRRSIACRSPTPGSCPMARRSSTARRRAPMRRSCS